MGKKIFSVIFTFLFLIVGVLSLAMLNAQLIDGSSKKLIFDFFPWMFDKVTDDTSLGSFETQLSQQLNMLKALNALWYAGIVLTGLQFILFLTLSLIKPNKKMYGLVAFTGILTAAALITFQAIFFMLVSSVKYMGQSSNGLVLLEDDNLLLLKSSILNLGGGILAGGLFVLVILIILGVYHFKKAKVPVNKFRETVIAGGKTQTIEDVSSQQQKQPMVATQMNNNIVANGAKDFTSSPSMAGNDPREILNKIKENLNSPIGTQEFNDFDIDKAEQNNIEQTSEGFINVDLKNQTVAKAKVNNHNQNPYINEEDDGDDAPNQFEKQQDHFVVQEPIQSIPVPELVIARQPEPELAPMPGFIPKNQGPIEPRRNNPNYANRSNSYGNPQFRQNNFVKKPSEPLTPPEPTSTFDTKIILPRSGHVIADKSKFKRSLKPKEVPYIYRDRDHVRVQEQYKDKVFLGDADKIWSHMRELKRPNKNVKIVETNHVPTKVFDKTVTFGDQNKKTIPAPKIINDFSNLNKAVNVEETQEVKPKPVVNKAAIKSQSINHVDSVDNFSMDTRTADFKEKDPFSEELLKKQDKTIFKPKNNIENLDENVVNQGDLRTQQNQDDETFEDPIFDVISQPRSTPKKAFNKESSDNSINVSKAANKKTTITKNDLDDTFPNIGNNKSESFDIGPTIDWGDD